LQLTDLNFYVTWINILPDVLTVASATSFRVLELSTIANVTHGFAYDINFMIHGSTLEAPVPCSRLYSLVDLAREMKSRNILTIVSGYKKDRRWLAPYLYGETAPVKVMMFDSDHFWEEEKRIEAARSEEVDAGTSLTDRHVSGGVFAARLLANTSLRPNLV
jgi:hypothetical protein